MTSVKDKQLVLAELEKYKYDVEEAFFREDLLSAKHALRKYFYWIRYAHAYQTIDDTQLTERMTGWIERMENLFQISPYSAFEVSRESLKICSTSEVGMPTDICIVNAVCIQINRFTRPAKDAVLHFNKFMSIDETISFIEPLIIVLATTSTRMDSQAIQKTFFEALTEFEIVLFSSGITPSKRFDLVSDLLKYIGKNEVYSAIKRRMTEIIGEALYLPNGQGLILYPLEKQADRLGQEHIDWHKRKNVITVGTEFAVRADITRTFNNHHQRIEQAFKDKNYSLVRDVLLDFFASFAFDLQGETNTDQENGIDRNKILYFANEAEKLLYASPDDASSLAQACTEKIEDEELFDDELQTVVYEFVSKAIVQLFEQTGAYAPNDITMLKLILGRSSEFKDQELAEGVFNPTSFAFDGYLYGLHPAKRYKVMKELEIWLETREHPCSLLQEYIDEKMNATSYYKNIPFILFEGETFKEGQVQEFKP